MQTFTQIKKMSDKDVEKMFDKVAKHTDGGGVTFWLAEIQRRMFEKHNTRVATMTNVMVGCTIVIAILTVVIASK